MSETTQPETLPASPGLGDIWDVECSGGTFDPPADHPDAPVTPLYFTDPDTGEDEAEPFAWTYHQVSIATVGSHVAIARWVRSGDGRYSHHPYREMHALDFPEWTQWGHISVHGYETRDDETLVAVTWRISPTRSGPTATHRLPGED